MTPATWNLTPAQPGQGLTVEAWVTSAHERAEALQPLVSQWRPLATPQWRAYDATSTDGLICAGYYGAVFDGRHVYGCPIRSHRPRDSVHGHVLRCDTHGDFRDEATWEAFDAGGTDGLNTVCYYGAAFDGRHVIFAPRDDSKGYHSRVLRYDTRGPFKEPDAWSAHDAELPHSAQGAAFDGRHVYFCPGYESTAGQPLTESQLSGTVLRMDTSEGFHDAASYRRFDTKVLGPDAVCFDGGAFDGRYVYFVPLLHGVVVRHDTQGRFDEASSWEAFDARAQGLGMNVGAVFDGRWLYFCAYGHSSMVRYDTRRAFTDGNSWERWDAAGTGGLDTGGFDGGFFDGRYVHFCPWTRQAPPGGSMYHCNFLRYDTTRSFDDGTAWSAYDAAHTDGLLSLGYNAGAFDGRHFYGAPLYDGEPGDAYHGRVLRCDTVGEDGAFSLRYCDYGHNGGLCAAVPGPSFLVNTESGVRSIAAHRSLSAGRHHLVGVYNEQKLQLWIDGKLAAERLATGRLLATNVPITTSELSGGGARFDGDIERSRTLTQALDATDIHAAYQVFSAGDRPAGS
jgi:hypothetical protein